jgi:hypothetical protein
MGVWSRGLRWALPGLQVPNPAPVLDASEPRYMPPSCKDIRVSDDHVTAPVAAWNYEMRECLGGRKVMLLTKFGIAVLGVVQSDNRDDYIAWSPMPRRDRVEEQRRGISL